MAIHRLLTGPDKAIKETHHIRGAVEVRAKEPKPRTITVLARLPAATLWCFEYCCPIAKSRGERSSEVPARINK